MVRREFSADPDGDCADDSDSDHDFDRDKDNATY